MSPEYSSNCGRRNQSTGKTGLSNPRAKRRLNFEQQGDAEDVICSSRDEAFRDLASVLRGVMALKKQKRIASPVQDMLPKPHHGVFIAKRRLHLESLQSFNQQRSRRPCLEGPNKTTKINGRAFQNLAKDIVHELPFVKDTNEELGDRVRIQNLQKRTRVSLKERGIAPVSLGLHVLREKSPNKSKIMQSSQKFSSLLHNLVRMPEVEPSKGNARESDDNARTQFVDEIIDQSSKNNSTSSGKGLENAPYTQQFQEYCATLQLEHGRDPEPEGRCENGKELYSGSVLTPMDVPLDGNLNKKLKLEGSDQDEKDLLKVSVLEPLNEPLNENLNEELKFEGSCQNGRELLKGSVLGPVNEPMDENLKKEPQFEGNCQNIQELFKGSVQGPLNEPRNENLEKEPKFEGDCKNVKDLVKSSALGPVNSLFDVNAKKSGGDRGNELRNEANDKSFKKYSRFSGKKCRSRVFGKPLAVLHQGLENERISYDLLDLSKDIVQEHVNEPVDKKLKISNQDSSEQLGLCINLNIENCKGNGVEEHAREPLTQCLEIPCEFLREGLHNDSRMNMYSKELTDLGNNSDPKAAYQLFDEYGKETYGVINQKNGNQIVDCGFKKYIKGSIKKQRTEPASQVSITARAVLEGGLKPRTESNNQNFENLDKKIVQHPVNESVDEKIYNEERSMEPVSDVIDQVFLKCSKSLTKENGAEHASEGFENSCAVLQDVFGNESKIQNSASSVGPKFEFNLNPARPFSISPVANSKYKGPYPDYVRPVSEECRETRDRLLELHGFPEEFTKLRVRLKEKVNFSLAARQQLSSLDEKNGTENTKSEGNGEMVSCSETNPTLVPYEVHKTILDSLMSTLLSQNTTDVNSRRAFATLKKRFPTWDEVYKADPKAVEDAIRCGGLAEIKTSRIKNILKSLLKEQGKICLEHLRNMPIEQIKAELCRFKGVGPKTVACVLMFHLQHDDFPVDTHVFRITKSLGWVPREANREKAYLHLNQRIPNDLKFDLNCLLVTHGKRCSSCSKRGRLQHAPDGNCPILRIGVTNN